MVGVIILALIVAGVAYYAGSAIARKKVLDDLVKKREDARTIIEEARKNADSILKEAELQSKDLLIKTRAEMEKEFSRRRREIEEFERKLRRREDNLEKRAEYISMKEQEIEKQNRELQKLQESIEAKRKEVEAMFEEASKRLQEISGLTREQAREQLMESVYKEMRKDVAKLVADMETQAREEAEARAREIIATAIQRQAAEYVYDNSVSVVSLPSDDMKGRIIGREGRNIRAFEAATGVDVIVDDTPEVVVVSSLNPIRREIAKMALEKLVADGRIHPARIEEMVKRSEHEVENKIRDLGRQAVNELGLGEVHPDIVKMIGRLKYRTSYSQNVYHHSLEVAYISGIIAAELGLDEKLARRAGLLHDIGKAVDHEVEGSHTEIGYDVVRRYREPEEVLVAIRDHHSDKPSNIYAVIVQAADALSAARPGARREMYEAYVKRVEELEEIAGSFEGVEKAYAVQAGREVRVIVNPDSLSDEECVLLAREIAKKIESDMRYPGEIKVVVIRERRSVDYAR